jgi:hypothetical protein
MSTLVYWNNLNGNENWEDPGNWSYDAAGTSQVSFFDETEYFLWEGTTPGATDPCELHTGLTCAGFSMLTSVSSAIGMLGAFDLIAKEDQDTVPGGITVNLGFPGFTCDPTVNLRIGESGVPGTFNIHGASSGQRFLAVYLDAENSDLNINGSWEMRSLMLAGSATVFALSALACALIFHQEDAAPAVNSTGGSGTFNLGCPITVLNCSTTPVFDPGLTLNVAVEGPNNSVSLSICRGPLSVAVPQWAVDHSAGGAGALTLNFNQDLPGYDGTSIDGEWTDCDVLNGGSWGQLTLGSSICGNSDQEIGYQFTGASPVLIGCDGLDLTGGPQNTVATRYYSLGDPVTINVGLTFVTSDHGNIEYGLLFPGNHLQCTRFYAPAIQGWDGLSDARNISLSGTNNEFVADFSLGINAWVTNLTFTTPGRFANFFGRSALINSPGSDVLTLQGKLDLPDNDFRYKCIPDGTYTVNLVTGVDAAAVVRINGAIVPWS